MKAAWLVVGTLATVVLSTAQDKATVVDFTKSPTEHIIIQLEQPFVVRSVKGFIRRKQGDQEPLPNVLIEIPGPGNDRTIKRTTTNEHGRFRMGHVAEGQSFVTRHISRLCVVRNFVAQNARWRVGMAVRISEGHITCDAPNLPFVCRYESLLKLSSSAEPQSPV
jgi:hypothetical protein